MIVPDDLIINAAVKRIAFIFKIPADKVQLNMKFSDDFKVGISSDFQSNEFDKLHDDIRDVADRKITKDIESGALVISTVGDYCDHMIRSYLVNSRIVVKLLSL